LSFITISDPGQFKLPSQRKIVRSHAASNQASRGRSGLEPQARKRQPRRRQREASWRGEVITLDVRASPKRSPTHRELDFPAEIQDQIIHPLNYQGIRILGEGRVDPFQSYPISWEPFLPELVDHCSYLFHLFSKVSKASTDIRHCQISPIWRSTCRS
jgi:hypothetical protein